MSGNVLVQSMYGLGDNIYARAFVSSFPGAYVATPWPEIYDGLDVRCVRPPAVRLRTQTKNTTFSDYPWATMPASITRVFRPSYNALDMRRGSILAALRRVFGVDPVMSLPTFDSLALPTDKPIAVVRPVTLRREWLNSARNPDPGYIAQAAAMLRERGYYVVSVADLQAGQEWICPPVPIADKTFHLGELTVRPLLGLIRQAAVVVGGVGWIVPACLATGTPLFCVLGGNGGNNRPATLTDPAFVDSSRVGWAQPDPFCECTINHHTCEKTIHGFDTQFSRWLGSLQQSTPDQSAMVA